MDINLLHLWLIFITFVVDVTFIGGNFKCQFLDLWLVPLALKVAFYIVAK